MDSSESKTKPHVVCLPFPAQGHINPMLQLAKLLHHKGFRITFVNTERNHKLVLKSQNNGPNSVDGNHTLPDFHFETIPDGQSKDDSAIEFFLSASKNSFRPFCELVRKLENVTCLVSDACITYGFEAAAEFGIPYISLFTTSACGFLAYMQFSYLVDHGIMPPQDASMLSNEYLDKFIDWIPALSNVRLKDLPSFIVSPNDVANLDYFIEGLMKVKKCTAVVVNTFDALERKVLDALSIILPPIYTVGPLGPLLESYQLSDTDKHMSLNLFKEESECLDWLNTKETNSVVFVNFGSMVVLTHDQLLEFAWGLANCNFSFLWVIRPDIVSTEELNAILPQEFMLETQGRCMLTSWCPQEKVLKHPSIGCFLTHSGWNSTLESVCGGVPMICWPIFAEQRINCIFCCTEWGIGSEMDKCVKRENIEKLLKDVMSGNIGKEMKSKAAEFKYLAEEATQPGGSSYQNLDKLITEVILSEGKHC